MDDEFRTVGLDDWSSIFGAEHMRQISSLENRQEEQKDKRIVLCVYEYFFFSDKQNELYYKISWFFKD